MRALLRDTRAVFSNHVIIPVSQRVRHDNEWKAHVAYPFGYDLRERREGGADNRNGRNAEVFEFGRVTRGPGGR